MRVRQNNTRDWFGLGGGNRRVSFEEHNEYMRWFRQAHAEVAWSNRPKADELARLESMLPLRVNRATVDTGGSRFCHDAVDWSALVPLWKVASYKLSSN